MTTSIRSAALFVTSGLLGGICFVIACEGDTVPVSMETVDAQSNTDLDGGAGGACSCTIPEPLAITGSVKTAESDPENWRMGSESLDSNVSGGESYYAKLADGPMVITHTSARLNTNPSRGEVQMFVAPVGECSAAFQNVEIPIFSTTGAVVNASGKIFVPTGHMLCALNTSNSSVRVSWFGHTP
ncbi:hypothetical protein [Haliangium sp.]|uniref:hypothetical protein n=1 Tax=Haliangium sp. TaxID=2663208 RepID=UPI003D0D5F12